jgi:uncharacterized protein YjiS (DUF1127 family)
MINPGGAYQGQSATIPSRFGAVPRTTTMNALIHSFDRLEPVARTGRQGFWITAWRRFTTALRASRERQALSQLSEWNEHMLQDIGLTRDDVRSPRAISDGCWLINNTRLGER